MVAATAEHTAEADPATPAAEATWTSDAIIAQARALAYTFDSQHWMTYSGMDDRRWVQSVDLGADLLTAHAAYRLHNPRGRGRRQHAAALYALLDETNGANLVAALALLFTLGRILDGTPHDG